MIKGPNLSSSFLSLSIVLLLLCVSATTVVGQQVWEGNASQARRGEFETEGFFAASNSFPKNTVVEVQNTGNGGTVRVTVVERISDNPNIFILLSARAAQKLGIAQGDIGRVRVEVVRGYGDDVFSREKELVENPDPEVNPNAEQLPGVEEKEGEEVIAAREEAAESPAEEAARPSDRGVLSAEDVVVEKATRDPQKNLYVSPREARLFVSPDLVPPDEVAGGEEPPVTEPPIHLEQEEGPSASVEPPEPEEAAAASVRTVEPRVPESVAERPAVDQGPEPSPDPPRAEETRIERIAAREPDPPGEIAEGPEVTAAPPEPDGGERLAIRPGEPEVPGEDQRAGDASVEPPRPEAGYEVAFVPDEPEPPGAERMAEAEGPSATPEPPPSLEKEPLTVAQEDPEPPETAVGPEIAEATTPPEREEERAGVSEPEEPSAERPAAEEEVPAREEPSAGTREREEIRPPREEPPELAGLEEESLRSDPASGRIYFIQIGAYTDETLARSVEATYARNYPIDVYRSGMGPKGVYRVLVGPLNKDESGAVLYWFRAKGFKDAFIRSVN